MWDVKNGRNLFPGAAPAEPDAEVEHKRIVQLVYQRNSRRLFIATADQSILLFDLPRLKPVHQFSGYNDEIFDVKFLAEDRFAVVATNSPRLKVYNVTTADCKFADGHTDSVLCVAVFQQDNLVVTGSKVRLISLREGRTQIIVTPSAFRTLDETKTFCSRQREEKRVTWWEKRESRPAVSEHGDGSG